MCLFTSFNLVVYPVLANESISPYRASISCACVNVIVCPTLANESIRPYGASRVWGNLCVCVMLVFKSCELQQRVCVCVFVNLRISVCYCSTAVWWCWFLFVFFFFLVVIVLLYTFYNIKLLQQIFQRTFCYCNSYHSMMSCFQETHVRMNFQTCLRTYIRTKRYTSTRMSAKKKKYIITKTKYVDIEK